MEGCQGPFSHRLAALPSREIIGLCLTVEDCTKWSLEVHAYQTPVQVVRGKRLPQLLCAPAELFRNAHTPFTISVCFCCNLRMFCPDLSALKGM